MILVVNDIRSPSIVGLFRFLKDDDADDGFDSDDAEGIEDVLVATCIDDSPSIHTIISICTQTSGQAHIRMHMESIVV